MGKQAQRLQRRRIPDLALLEHAGEGEEEQPGAVHEEGDFGDVEGGGEEAGPVDGHNVRGAGVGHGRCFKLRWWRKVIVGLVDKDGCFRSGSERRTVLQGWD